MKIVLVIAFAVIANGLYGQKPVTTLAEEGNELQQPFISKLLELPADKGECMTPAEKAYYDQRARELNEKWRLKLAAEGKPVPDTGRAGRANHILLEWPMKVSGDYDMQYKYFYKGNFVDQYQDDTAVHLDYNCWSRTYNGHDASDISLWPFWWRMMDKMYVTAVAAAPGVIIEKVDTIYDRQCVIGNPGSNRVWIRHFDGTTTRYHHLKKNGVTSKEVNDTVVTGEFLGYIASSGNSTNPHLHFAVYDWLDRMIEPFFINNNCNFYATETWWNNQEPYWDSKVNRVMTHSAPPTLEHCTEIVNAKNNFNPGDPLYVGIAFSENQNNDLATYIIVKPDGNTFASWFVSMPFQDIRNYSVDGYTLPAGNNGTWKIEVTYRGSKYYHFFTVGCPANLAPGGTQSGSNGYIAANTISSTVNHSISAGDKVLYQAQDHIVFKPGFRAPAGVILKTRLAGCGYAE